MQQRRKSDLYSFASSPAWKSWDLLRGCNIKRCRILVDYFGLIELLFKFKHIGFYWFKECANASYDNHWKYYITVFATNINIVKALIRNTPDKIDDHIVLGEVHYFTLIIEMFIFEFFDCYRYLSVLWIPYGE